MFPVVHITSVTEHNPILRCTYYCCLSYNVVDQTSSDIIFPFSSITLILNSRVTVVAHKTMCKTFLILFATD